MYRHLRHPRLRTKLIISAVVAACVAMAVQFGVSSQRVEANLGEIEAERLSEDIDVALSALDQLRIHLERAVMGSSVGVTFADAVGRDDHRWLEENAVRRLARAYSAQSVTVFDAQGRPLVAGGLPIPGLAADPAIPAAWDKGVVGSKYVYKGGDLWLIATAPILARDDDMDVKGVLALGQLIDDRFAGIVGGLISNEVTLFVQGEVIAATDAELAGALAQPDALAELTGGRGLVVTSGHASGATHLGVDGTNGLMVVSNDRAPISAAQAALQRSMLFALVPAVALACLVAIVLSVQLGRPLRSLRGAVTAIAFGDLEQRVTTAGDDEIADLGRAFNAMAERVSVAQETLRRAAVRDSLTGLLNHREFYRRLTDEIARCERGVLPLSVMMIDLDYFKGINDTYGHLRGDAVLRETASMITRCVREGDVVARYAGDEFAVILPGTAERDAQRIAERLRVCAQDVLEATDLPSDEQLTLSIGVATRWPGEHTANQTVELADLALYQAKQAGRNRVAVGEDVHV